jgi:hypothetical protein
MEMLVRLCWLVLAVVHLPPAAATVVPGLIERLYGVEPKGDVGVLLVHRAVLFLAVAAASVYAVFVRTARPVSSIVVATSIMGFLAVYLRAGSPRALHMIAVVDMVVLIPLGVVMVDAWVGR